MAWQRGLLSGFNGNVSLRQGEVCFITQSGAAKGHLLPENVATVRIADGVSLCGQPSSELAMHLEVYRRVPETGAIVHTHPRHLLALDLLEGEEAFLRLPLFEAERMRQRLGFVPALEPGTRALAEAVGREHTRHEAVWLSRHGLSCRGGDLVGALALAEELEHLAAVQLLARQPLA